MRRFIFMVFFLVIGAPWSQASQETMLLVGADLIAGSQTVQRSETGARAQAEERLAKFEADLERVKKILAGASGLRNEDRESFNYRLEDAELGLSEARLQFKRANYPAVLEQSSKWETALLQLEKEIKLAMKKAAGPGLKAKKKKVVVIKRKKLLKK